LKNFQILKSSFSPYFLKPENYSNHSTTMSATRDKFRSHKATRKKQGNATHPKNFLQNLVPK